MRDFRKYQLYQNSLTLQVNVFRSCRHWGAHELYTLGQQMMRSSCSIASNLAEGASRSSQRDFRRFIEIAIGSSFELESQMDLAVKLELFDPVEGAQFLDQLTVIQKQLNALRTKLNRSLNP